MTVVFPWLLLFVLEGGLRLAGYGSAYPLFVADRADPELLVPNRDVALRYFRNGSIAPQPQLDFFRARKEAGTFRIFFQGESSAAGFPYRHGGAPSRMLAQRLQETFPGRHIEVVNTALTGVNSYTVLDLADEVIAQHPDAVMIYTGHNEYYGVLGVGSTQSLGSWPRVVRAYLALRRLRTVQLLEALLRGGASSPSPRDAESPRTVMELLSGRQRIALGTGAYRQGIEQFRANLGALLAKYRAHGVPVFIGTVASNERDQKPLISGFAPGSDSAAWRRRYDAGMAALARGDTSGAERSLDQALGIDSLAADAYYLLARLHDARGEYPRARALYRAAKERDELRFRAPEAINDVIREEATRHSATVVETQAALASASPGGIVGRTLMLEHLHPNIDGYFVIADAFYESLRRSKAVGPWAGAVPRSSARSEIPVTRVDSLVGVFRTERLLAGWPFRPAGENVVTTVDTLRGGTPEQTMAQQLIAGSLAWPDATERLRRDAEARGDYAEAVRAARALAEEFRYAPEPYMEAARMALAGRRYEDGLRYARAAHERRETANTANLIGLLLLRLGSPAEAVTYLRRATVLAPGERRMSDALAAAEAIPGLEESRARAPRDVEVLFKLATVYALTQQPERSRVTLAALQRIAPAHAGASELLKRLPPPGQVDARDAAPREFR